MSSHDDELMTGTVAPRGVGLFPTYGFIEGDDGERYFVLPAQSPHFSRLKGGERVRFAVYEHEKGLRAKDVEVLP